MQGRGGTNGFAEVMISPVVKNARDFLRLVTQTLDCPTHPERMKARVTDAVLTSLATEVVGKLGGKVSVAPCFFLRKLMASILDRVDVFSDFEPTKDLALRIDADELTLEEPAEAAGRKADDIEIDL